MTTDDMTGQTPSPWEQLKQAVRDGVEQERARQQRHQELRHELNQLSVAGVERVLNDRIGKKLANALANRHYGWDPLCHSRERDLEIQALMEHWRVVWRELDRRWV